MNVKTTIEWRREHEDLHHARLVLEAVWVLSLQVESLWEHGWDWHVSDSSGRLEPRYGLAESLEEAKAKAEFALDAMLLQLDGVQPHPPSPLN